MSHAQRFGGRSPVLVTAKPYLAANTRSYKKHEVDWRVLCAEAHTQLKPYLPRTLDTAASALISDRFVW